MSTAEDIMDDARDEERADFEDWLREREEVERWLDDNREWELAVGATK